MPNLKIRVYPDPDLRVKAEEVTNVGLKEKKELEDMAAAMYLNNGVGLAATQVGIRKQLIVIDIGEGLVKLANPVLTAEAGKETGEEGCLSVPGECITIKRAKNVVVDFLNENSFPSRIKADGLLARALQHEIDHLQGKLIVDYLNPVKKFLVRARSGNKKGKNGTWNCIKK